MFCSSICIVSLFYIQSSAPFGVYSYVWHKEWIQFFFSKQLYNCSDTIKEIIFAPIISCTIFIKCFISICNQNYFWTFCSVYTPVPHSFGCRGFVVYFNIQYVQSPLTALPFLFFSSSNFCVFILGDLVSCLQELEHLSLLRAKGQQRWRDYGQREQMVQSP